MPASRKLRSKWLFYKILATNLFALIRVISANINSWRIVCQIVMLWP